MKGQCFNPGCYQRINMDAVGLYCCAPCEEAHKSHEVLSKGQHTVPCQVRMSEPDYLYEEDLPF